MLVEVPTAVTSPWGPSQLGNVLCGFRVLGVKWSCFDSSRVKQFGKELGEGLGVPAPLMTVLMSGHLASFPTIPTKHTFDVCVYLEHRRDFVETLFFLFLFFSFHLDFLFLLKQTLDYFEKGSMTVYQINSFLYGIQYYASLLLLKRDKYSQYCSCSTATIINFFHAEIL